MATKTVSSKSVPAPKTTTTSKPSSTPASAPDSRDYGKSVSYKPNDYSFRNSPSTSVPSSAPDSRDYGKSVSYTPSNYSFRNSSSGTGGGGSTAGGGGGYTSADYAMMNAGQAAAPVNTPVPTLSPPPTFAVAGQLPKPTVQTQSVPTPETAVASAVSTSVPGTTTSNVPAPKNPLDYYLSEIGRSQLAYGEYKGRADLQNLAHQNANNLKTQAKADGWNLTPYEGKDYTQYYKGSGTAGAYDPTQSGKVQRAVPAPGGPSGNPVSDAQNGFQFNPTAPPYPTKTPEQITAQIQAQVQAQIQSKKTLADQQKQAYQLSYDRMNATETDQRALENNQFERNNNPYSGGSDYRRAMLDRERNITDRQQNEDLMAKLGSVDKELYDYIQNASVEEQKQIMDMVNQERSYALQYQNQDFSQQKGTYDSNRNAYESDRNYNRGTFESDRTFKSQQDAAKAEAAQKALANEWASSEAIGKVTPKLSKLTGIPAGTPTIEARKMATQQDQFNKTYQLDKDKAAFDKWSEKERIAITKAANQTEKEYKDYLKNQQISETTAKNRTKQAVADVMGTDTREEALDILKTTSGQLGQDGVDIREVLAAIDSRYPGGQNSTAEELKQIELELKKQEYQDATGKPYQAPKQVGG